MPQLAASARALALVAMTALAAAACGKNTGSAPECQSDDPCGSGAACVGGSCIARTPAPVTWGIELEPSSDEPQAALTEWSVAAGGAALDITAARKVAVTGRFIASAELQAPTSGHVVLTVPPGIPGRPDIQLETDVMVSSVDAVIPFFTVAASEGVIGRMARVTVTPSAPDDQVRAPISFQARLEGPEVMLPLPPRSFTVNGNLYSAIGVGRKDFLARAFLDSTGQLLSNVSRTNDGGGFSLTIPNIVELDDPAQTVTVELEAADSDAAEPRFLSRHFSLGIDPALTLGNLFQPAFANPNVFRFNLRGGAADGPAVADAVIRARTVLVSDDVTGSAYFLRDGRSDREGNVDLGLLPGTANTSRSYLVAIVPPAGSPYGVVCVPSFPVAAGGTAAAPAHLQVITLPRRPTLEGTVVSADGLAVDGVSVKATPIAPDVTTACTGSPPAFVVTADGGRFSLALDPGTYRIDYDPPQGAPLPRLTESEVTVADDAVRAVQLPRGGVVEGRAFRPDGSPLPSAAVRLYEILCGAGAAPCTGVARREPLLRAQTRTDVSGRFRAVIPLSTGP